MKTHVLWGWMAGLSLVVVGGPVAGPRLLAAEIRLRATLKGQSHGVRCVAFSPDGKTMASGSEEETITLWDVASGKPKATLRGHTSAVASVAFSPDGKTVASGSVDKTIKLWDLRTTQNTATLKGHSLCWCVAFSPDGKRLASASEDETIKLWDVATGKNMATLKGHNAAVASVAFSPDGRTVASGSDDCTIKLWNVASGRNTATLKGHGRFLWCVAFSPDGKILASASEDRTIQLWDVATAKERATLQGHAGAVLSVAFSADGKNLASAGDDSTIRLWEVPTGKQWGVLKGHCEPVLCVAFSPHGTVLASGNEGHTIKLWDVLAAEPAGKKAEPARSASLSGKDLEGLWATLACGDAAKAYRAMHTLIRAPEQAVAFLKTRLRPGRAPDPAQINRWLMDLDSTRFVVRRKATEALEGLGESAEPVLRKKLAEHPSPEVQRRIEQLLASIEQLPPELIRVVRAVEVLEHIGSPEAKRLLETLRTGAEGARLPREATASLDRLNKRVAAEKRQKGCQERMALSGVRVGKLGSCPSSPEYRNWALRQCHSCQEPN